MNGIAIMGGKFRAELKFWMIHCFVSAAPIIAFALRHGSSRTLVEHTLGSIFGVILFALACALIAMKFGGFAKSRAIFPRSLRVVFHLRALQVGLFFLLFAVGMLVKPIASFAIFFVVPDFICGYGATIMYDHISQNVTVQGSAILQAWHPFLRAFVFMGLFALVWSVVFFVLTLPTMLVMRLCDVIKRQRRARGIR